MVSCCLSATGVRFSVIRYPPGSWALLTVGLPNHTGPDPDGVTAFRTHELRPGWAPSIPRGRRCSSRPVATTGRRPPLRSGQSLHPAYVPSGRVSDNEASTRVQAIRPSGLPLACGHPDGTGSPWAHPRASHPRRPRADDARRGGDRPSSTDLELPLNSHSSVSNPVVHSMRATSRRTSPIRSWASRPRRDDCDGRDQRAQLATTAR